jgi:hypothetical protein
MTNSEMSLNTAKNAARAVQQQHYDLERTQPVDQLEEGRKWDRKVAKAANGSGSSKSRRR